MTTNNEERVRGFVNVFGDGMGKVWPTLRDARCCVDVPTTRTAELVELRPGETIVTLEMREKIERIAAIVGERSPSVVDQILLILDGKDGQ